jgi:hypothetical protein
MARKPIDSAIAVHCGLIVKRTGEVTCGRDVGQGILTSILVPA